MPCLSGNCYELDLCAFVFCFWLLVNGHVFLRDLYFESQIDGVDALNNILLIGMTNRKDLLDEALLRFHAIPGVPPQSC